MRNTDYVDQKEMELRQNKDFIASLDMVGEGAPIYQMYNEEIHSKKSSTKKDSIY